MKIYACLVGEWIDITNSGKIDNRDPVIFIEEELGHTDSNKNFHSFEYDYVNIEYNGNTYRIHPSLIQIVH